ncbi:DNA binding [Euphorbia peplus]|nr:DNA binding [Euphorbia peplus]
MHALKGGWAGQVFAQAKRNESSGRKPRRLSKEKRKELVESFIKKHQDLNNGKFPSLSLTHREVGGSFYTIREIVRDVIQENRVLGPAKSLPEEKDTDQSFKQFPLGTISIEPEASRAMPEDGSSIGSYNHEETNEELSFISDKVYPQPCKSDIINGSHKTFSNEEYHDVKVANDQVSELLETKKNMEEAPLSRTKVTDIEDVIVETFPLPAITLPTGNSEENSGVATDLKGSLVEEDVEKPVLPGTDMSLSDRVKVSCNSSLVDDVGVESIAGERDSGLVNKKAVKATTDLLNHSQVDIDVEVMTSSSDKAIAEAKVVNASNVTETKGINGTYASAKITEPTSNEEVIIEKKADIDHSSSSEKKNNPTLDRINLESWQVETKTPQKPPTNPVVAAFKSIVAAIVKFLS